jgi:hypothetical protein
MSPPIAITMICRFLSDNDNCDHDLILSPIKNPITSPNVIPMKNPICIMLMSDIPNQLSNLFLFIYIVF